MFNLTPAQYKLLAFVVVALLGFIAEMLMADLYHKFTKNHYKEHHVTLSRYMFFLLFPLLGTFAVLYTEGMRLLQVFIVFTLAGTFLEAFVGWSYHKIMGHRLWTYHKWRLTKYTSVLAMPFWGIGGVFFWLIVKAFE